MEMLVLPKGKTVLVFLMTEGTSKPRWVPVCRAVGREDDGESGNPIRDWSSTMVGDA